MVSCRTLILLLVLTQVGILAQSFSHSSQRRLVFLPRIAAVTTTRNNYHYSYHHHHHHQQEQKQKQQATALLTLRGGQQQQQKQQEEEKRKDTTSKSSPKHPIQLQSMVTATLFSFGKYYSKSLESCPIITKSLTAGFVFGFSDLLAQTIESRRIGSSTEKAEKEKQNISSRRTITTITWKRTIAATLVGLLYFGPAAHYWYNGVFYLFPGTTIVSILQKAILGQLIFGPTFTCIYFASALIQAGEFSLRNWLYKIRSDLFKAWIAGVGYWPLVDLISFSIVPMKYIPLFVNFCALVWNVYLSLVANAEAKAAAMST